MRDLSVSINDPSKKYIRTRDNNSKISVSRPNKSNSYRHVILGNLNKDPKSKTIIIRINDKVFACSLYPSLEAVVNEFRVVDCNLGSLVESKCQGLVFGKYKELNSLY